MCAGSWPHFLLGFRSLSSGSPGVPRGQAAPDTGVLPRHRRVRGDPRHLCQWHLHQSDRELPLRVPYGLLLQQCSAGLRRYFLPALAALVGMLVLPPLSSLGRSFKLHEPPFPPLCNETNTFSIACIPRNHPHSGSGCFQRDHPLRCWGLGLGLIWQGRCPLHSCPVRCIPQTWMNVPLGKVPASRMPTASTSLAATAASAPEGTSCRQAGLVWVSGDPNRHKVGK